MRTQAQVKAAIVDLAGPLPEGVTPAQADTARRTLSWCLGQYPEDTGLVEAISGVKPARPKVEAPAAPPPPATPPPA